MAGHSPRSTTVYGWAFSQVNNGSIWLDILPGQQWRHTGWHPRGRESPKEITKMAKGILGGTPGGENP